MKRVFLILILARAAFSQEISNIEILSEFNFNLDQDNFETDALSKFGVPIKTKIDTSWNIYHEHFDSIKTYFYPGFKFSFYIVDSTKSFLIYYEIQEDITPLPFEIKIGDSKRRIKNIFGEDYIISENDEIIHYRTPIEMYCDIYFKFEKTKLNKIIFEAFID